MKNKVHQQGFSLIEIMISLVIGTFLLGGVLQIFMHTRETNKMQENLSRMQENGRFTLDLLTQDIRMAGFRGCAALSTVVSDPIPLPAFTTATEVTANNDTTNNWDSVACGPSSKCTIDTDVIHISFAESCHGNLSADMTGISSPINISTNNTCSINSGDALLISSCQTGDIFRSTSSGTTISHSPLNNIYTNNAATELFKYHAYSYFIRESETGSSEKSLWRWDRAATASSSNPVELTEGIENMQVIYGEDTDSDGVANYYVDADAAALNMANVVSIRISLLMRSKDNNLTSIARGYDYMGSSIAATSGDKYLRRVFTSTIAVRNRLR